MQDITGDGLPDHVLKKTGSDTLFVKVNGMGKIGLLNKISIPTGGTYSIQYERAGNTVNMPQNKYVLASVTKEDGMEGTDSGVHSYTDVFKYSDKDYMKKLDEAYLELSDVFPDLMKYDFTAAAKPKNDFAFKANWGHLHKFLPDEIKKFFNPGHIADLLEQPQWTESFSYDTKGNIANKTNGWGDISYTYNAENQLVKAGMREYSFDANGNMTAEWTGDLTASYAYDAENR